MRRCIMRGAEVLLGNWEVQSEKAKHTMAATIETRPTFGEWYIDKRNQERCKPLLAIPIRDDYEEPLG